MKKDEFKEKLNQMSQKELEEQLVLLQRELFGLRLNTATAHIKDYSQFKKVKKNVARIITVLQHKKAQEMNKGDS